MPERCTIGEKHETRVNFLKLIQDLREQFPYDPLSSLIIETIANSIDAKASSIEISIASDGSIYQIMDNGSGMTQDEFVEYHNIASVTKSRGGGIGFAGVGAKIFLDRCEYIITETKARGFYATSKWAFANGTLIWEYIPTQNKVEGTGTFVEVKLKTEEDGKKLTPDSIIQLVREHYNAILQGHYNILDVIINGKRIEPWISSDIEHRKDFDFKCGGHRIRGFLIKARNKLPDEFQGPYIVVHGKTIQQHWFKQYPLMSETFTGIIMADYLVDILRTSKAQFDYTSMLWKKFHVKMGKVLSDWLDVIGAKPRLPTVSTELDRLARDIEQSINEVLRAPEFTDLADSLFQNIIQRPVGIRSGKSTITGIETEGVQDTTGTFGGLGEGGGVKAVGPDDGICVTENERGEIPIERVSRRVRGGIKIGYENNPNILEESWINPAQRAVIINKGFPSFGAAYVFGAEGYHILRCVIGVLLQEVEVEDAKKRLGAFFSRWCEQQSVGD